MESKADSIFANRQTIEKYDVELWQALEACRMTNVARPYLEAIS